MSQRELNNQIGLFLEESVRKVLNGLGFSVMPHEVFEEGIDVTAKKDSLSIIAECLNWNEKSYINFKRMKSLVRNFLSFPEAIKILFVSYDIVSKRQKDFFERLGVSIVKIGEQIFDTSRNELSLILGKLYRFLCDKGVLQNIEIISKETIKRVERELFGLETEPNDEFVIDYKTNRIIKTYENDSIQADSINVSSSQYETYS
jgi:hypothetical protein